MKERQLKYHYLNDIGFSPVLFHYDISSVQSVCGRIRTFGALPHTTLAEWHHKPLGHANVKWMGQDSNLRCFCVTDLQSAALAARHTHPWGE